LHGNYVETSVKQETIETTRRAHLFLFLCATYTTGAILRGLPVPGVSHMQGRAELAATTSM